MALHIVHYRHNHDGDGMGPEWSYAFRTAELAEAWRVQLVRASVRSSNWGWDEDDFDEQTEHALADFNDWACDVEYLYIREIDIVSCNRRLNQINLPE